MALEALPVSESTECFLHKDVLISAFDFFLFGEEGGGIQVSSGINIGIKSTNPQVPDLWVGADFNQIFDLMITQWI